ncbi:hypothetical protein AB0F72_08315 [Actinoplanes sp. NPDC023936]|uniref:hypothetical protein n=1 Tax=Actinoplanes sp. NPDC023936 TaxID=3154910 RepID=UPI003410E2AD
MHDIGMDTRDLGTLGVTHPAEKGLPASETETNLRRVSAIWLITAGGILAITTISALTIGALTVEHGINSSIIRLLIILGVGIASNVACALLAAALVEYAQRQQRTLIRKAMARASDNAKVGALNAALLEQLVNRCNSLVDQIAAQNRELAAMRSQIKGMEAQLADVPGFSEGVERGARVTALALRLDND